MKYLFAKNHKAIECDNCGLWVHLKYNKFSNQTYKYFQNDSCVWFCISCSSKIFPFPNLNGEDFHKIFHGKKKKKQEEQTLIEKNKSCYRQRRPRKLLILFSCK